MSQELRRTGPLPDDATTDGPNAIDTERAPADNRQPSRRPPLRARPQSWHPYGPVEPPLDVSSARSIGVHAILNPPGQAAAIDAVSTSREPLSLPGPSASSRPRQGSSPAPRIVHHLAQQQLSPRAHPRSLKGPGSPSARFVGSGRTSGQSSVAHSPVVPQEPPLGLRQPPSSSSLPLESALRPITSLPPVQPPNGDVTKLDTQSSLPKNQHRPRPSNEPEFAGDEPYNTSFKLQSLHTRISRSDSCLSPANGAAVLSTAALQSNRFHGSRNSSNSRDLSHKGRINQKRHTCRRQAEKRKANSDASRRFRNRKRNEVQLEQRLGAQQDEIQRHVETVRRQSQEIRSLAQQRDHYRSERDFYREQLGRSMSLSQLPPRPSSPHPQSSLLPPSDSTLTSTSTWAGDVPRSATAQTATASGRVLDSARQENWPASPASYSPAPTSGRALPPGPPPVAGGPFPPFQGTWTRQ
ncbi:hypothetical protein N7526_006984 [Penicillium atrosanguineum]|nr:hypothetical protein N7526_006984 [Penicillium atrosanguineum]